MKYIFIALSVLLLLGVIFWTAKEAPHDTDEQMNSKTYEIDGDVSSSVTVKAQENTIDLSGEGLTEVPGSVFNQTDVEVLDLSDNNLSGALQAEVRHLSHLRVLNLSNNAFTGVPAEVGQLSELEVLDLSDNPITGLPYELGNLKNLRVLDLRGTNFSSLDLEVIQQGLSSSVEIKVE